MSTVSPNRKTPAEVLAGSQQGGVSGNLSNSGHLTASAAIYKQGRKNPKTDRNQLAKQWQIEAYRHINICGEARFAATLFAAMAARAEIGVSLPNALARKAVWVEQGPEVDAFAELAPTVRERAKLVRDYMLHYIVAGESYLISRKRVDTDPDPYNPLPIWEIVAVTDIQKTGAGIWQVRHENDYWIDLHAEDPVIRLWNPDPSKRMEAWSPFRSLLPTLNEIEWLTAHIFRQVRSRLMSAGVWFLPNNMTFPAPPTDSVEGGEETIATLNEAEQFMLTLAASGSYELDKEDVSFPTVVMADPLALAEVDQQKLIKFWSEIDDKAMVLRSDAVRRFALGMDLPPERVIGATGVAVAGSGGSAGSANHWSLWAIEEQTIIAHVEPALDQFTGALTNSFLRLAVEGTDKVIAYNTAGLRLKQDRSQEAISLFDRGLLKGAVTVREVGFDPDNDMMDPEERKLWLLVKLAGGNVTPEQVNDALNMLGVPMPELAAPEQTRPRALAPGQPGRNNPRNTDGITSEGPPTEDHEHNRAAYSTQNSDLEAAKASFLASAEGLVLRALEKAGNRILNDGKRGRDKDRSTPAHMAHCVTPVTTLPEFDFTTLPTVFGQFPAASQAVIGLTLNRYCMDLYEDGQPYSRESLTRALRSL